jgi:hypothetical protein
MSERGTLSVSETAEHELIKTTCLPCSSSTLLPALLPLFPSLPPSSLPYPDICRGLGRPER